MKRSFGEQKDTNDRFLLVFHQFQSIKLMAIVLTLVDHTSILVCFSHSIWFPSSFLHSLSYFFLLSLLLYSSAQSFRFFLNSSCHFSFFRESKLNFNAKKHVICLDRSIFLHIIFIAYLFYKFTYDTFNCIWINNVKWKI